MTYAELGAVTARLRALRDEDGVDGETAAALHLGPGRTNGHALAVARADMRQIEDVVRASFLRHTRPEGNEQLYVVGTNR